MAWRRIARPRQCDAYAGGNLVGVHARQPGSNIILRDDPIVRQFATACVGALGFLPSTLAGLQLWLRSTDLVALSGADVLVWGDLTANNNDANTTAGSRLTFTAANALFNGLPSIDGNGTQHARITNAATLNNTAAGFTLYIVLNAPVNGAGARVLFDKVFGGNEYSAVLKLGALDADTFVRNATNTAWHSIASAVNIDDGVTHTTRFRFGSGLVGVRVDGGAESTAAAPNFRTDTADIGLLCRLNNTLFTTASLGEVIFYNRFLTVAEDALVQGYLQNRYATP